MLYRKKHVNLTFFNVVVFGKENKTGTIPKLRKLVKVGKFYFPFHMSKLEIKQNNIQVIDLTVSANKHSRLKANMMAPWWEKCLPFQPAILNWIPGLTWWKNINSPQELSSDLHIHTTLHTTTIKTKFQLG